MFAVVVAAIFMSNLDLFIVNVALPSIGRDFGGSSLAGLSWVLNAYAIVFAALLVPAGRLGDRTGQRRVFLAGIAVFTLASAACAVAPGLAFLVAARAVQAAGAAALIPTSLALLLAVTPVQQRAGRVRAWAAVGGVSAALGPVAGGLLVQVDWRWVFLVNLPVGLAALVAGARVLPHPPARAAEPLPDLLGAVLLTAAVGGLTGGLVEGPSWGWSSAGVLGLLAGSAAALGWFLWRCTHHERPLVELHLLRIPAFRSASAAVFVFGIGFAAMLLSNVLWCQTVWHYSALRTGLAIAPGPAMVPALAVGAGPLSRRIGPAPVAAAGNLLFAAGLLWRVVTVSVTPNYVLPAAQHAADRHGGGADAAHADQREHHGAAGRPVRHWVGPGQHGAAGRLGAGGGAVRDHPGHPGHVGGRGDRVPSCLAVHRRGQHGGRGHRVVRAPACGHPGRGGRGGHRDGRCGSR